MIYKTSMDNVTKRITIGVTILFVIIIGGQFAIIKDAGRSVPIYTTITLLSIYLITFAFGPISYEIADEQLIVHRIFMTVKISKNSIKSVELIDKDKIRPALSTFGVGRLFGYYRKFVNFKMGTMTWYATRKNNTVLVITKDNIKIILTPNEPVNFVHEFELHSSVK
jgi:hypothetical protein